MHSKKNEIFGAFFGCFVFITLIQSGTSIMCHNCSSEINPKCLDPFDKSSNEFLVNCSSVDEQRELPNNTVPHLCRKIDQTVNGVHRIIRYCAWEEHKARDCYLGATEYYKGKICICREDGCNHAPVIATPIHHHLLSAAFITFLVKFITSPFLS